MQVREKNIDTGEVSLHPLTDRLFADTIFGYLSLLRLPGGPKKSRTKYADSLVPARRQAESVL